MSASLAESVVSENSWERAGSPLTGRPDELPGREPQVVPLLPQGISMQQLEEARRDAANQGVSVMKALEERCGCTPDRLIAELGRLLRMPVLMMEDLHALAPVFE